MIIMGRQRLRTYWFWRLDLKIRNHFPVAEDGNKARSAALRGTYSLGGAFGTKGNWPAPPILLLNKQSDVVCLLDLWVSGVTDVPKYIAAAKEMPAPDAMLMIPDFELWHVIFLARSFIAWRDSLHALT